jgi:hypothetical protein
MDAIVNVAQISLAVAQFSVAAALARAAAFSVRMKDGRHEYPTRR